jgi:hypothetical protein
MCIEYEVIIKRPFEMLVRGEGCVVVFVAVGTGTGPGTYLECRCHMSYVMSCSHVVYVYVRRTLVCFMLYLCLCTRRRNRTTDDTIGLTFATCKLKLRFHSDPRLGVGFCISYISIFYIIIWYVPSSSSGSGSGS